MKITFLLTQSLESPSGLGRYWPLAKELVCLGHEVTIIALHHDFGVLRQRYFVRNGVNIYYVGQMHVLKRGNYKYHFSPIRLMLISTVATLQLIRGALQIPSDVYHVCKPHPMNGLAGLLAYVVKGKPIYLDCDDYEAASNRFSGKWQQSVVAFFEDRLPMVARGITVNTHFTANRLTNLGYPSGRIVYVPNGVDRDRFYFVSESDVESLRQLLGITSHKVIIYAGSMDLTTHAVDLLLEAFVHVRAEESFAKLVLVGGGKDYDELQAQAMRLRLGDATQFVGWVSPEKIPLYYRLAQVSVDPARNVPAEQARSPLKMFESWAMGIPFITTDVGDRCHLLGTPPAGLITQPNVTSLAEGIVTLLQCPDERNRLRALGLERVKSFYWDRLVKDFVKVYDV